MFHVLKPLFVAGMIASTAMVVAPASAQEAGSLLTQLKQSGAETGYMQGRGFRGGRGGFAGRGFGRGGFAGGRGFRNRGFAGRGGYGRGYGYGRRRGIGGAAVLGGLAAGALIGGAIASQAAPAPVYGAPGGNAVAYCQQRFRSYDPASGTYLGNDGARHACP